MDIIANFFHVLLYYFLPFIVVLGIMIFFHELGHFLIAKYFSVKVLKFSLGFGPVMIGKQVGETEYSIRYIPLGGFVKMLGEDIQEEETQDLTPEELDRAFHHQHVLKRIAIVGAGPIFNLLLALCLFFGLYFLVGYQVMTPEIGQVRPDSPAHQAGMQKGDIVLSVQGKKITDWSQMKTMVHDQAGKPLIFEIQRAGKPLTLSVTPEESVIKNEFGEEIKSALIGIVAAGKLAPVKLGLWQAALESARETWKWIKLTCLVVVKLFQGVVSIKTIGGPILIGQMTGKLAQESFSYLIPFMAIISINLGILNLFPIPILDGGVIIFLIIEMLSGKPVSIKKRELAQKVGLSLLIILMAIVFYNDILRLLE
ncbi:RIP metalloprotease RseP [Thermodesulfobacteriota bacterium]